ncbi:MAG TPA: amidohydrolase family protein [Pyrinomonadaceae bacterium]|nr:amidohydrolase family protein [Pyrinomonadaceae bacterium]
MTTLYCARWVLPISSAAIADGAVAVEGQRIAAVGGRDLLSNRFPEASVFDYGNAAIIPGLVNTHTHLELTAMRGFLEDQEMDFFAWLKKLTIARLERMTTDDLLVSATWGACEAARAGITCVADASDSAAQSMNALRNVGLRGIVFQESFGPDPRLAKENFQKLHAKVDDLRQHETTLVKCGVSPHAPYTVCASQLEMISKFAIDEHLPLMMHAAETRMEVSLIRDGEGPFADGLRARGIAWETPGVSPIQYLNNHGVLQTKPLLAHCIHVDDADLETLATTRTKISHCPKSNAKLSHGVAPFAEMLSHGLSVGLGSDSVASNNICDLIDEARFALLMARSVQAARSPVLAHEVIKAATVGGAEALAMEGQIGELLEGVQADFAAISLDGVHQIPAADAEIALIFSSSASDVTATVVAGKEVYRDGRVANVDEERLKIRMKEIGDKLRGMS